MVITFAVCERHRKERVTKREGSHIALLCNPYYKRSFERGVPRGAGCHRSGKGRQDGACVMLWSWHWVDALVWTLAIVGWPERERERENMYVSAVNSGSCPMPMGLTARTLSPLQELGLLWTVVEGCVVQAISHVQGPGPT